MSNILFIHTLYQPRKDEKDHFHALQAETINFRNLVRKEEVSKYWMVARIRRMVHKRRDNFELIQGGKSDKLN